MSRKYPKPRHARIHYPPHARQLQEPREPRETRAIGGLHFKGEAFSPYGKSSGHWIVQPDGALGFEGFF